MSHTQRPKEVKDSKIVILTCPFEPQKPKLNITLVLPVLKTTKNLEQTLLCVNG